MKMHEVRLSLVDTEEIAYTRSPRMQKNEKGKIKARRFQHLHTLVGFMFGFVIAFAMLLLQDKRILLESERLKHPFNSTTEFYQQSAFMDVGETDFLSSAEQLYKNVRVLCMVLTCAKYHETRAIHVQRTWGKRCNKLIFISSEQNDDLGSVAVVDAAGDTWDGLWNKTREGFRYVFEEFYDNYDWFVKADDDTYMIMENLRYMLHAYSTDMPIFFGYMLKQNDVTYASGGAAYIFSKETLQRFITDVYYNESSVCNKVDEYPPEDLQMSICLKNIGVQLIDTALATIGDEKSKMFPLDLASYMDSKEYNGSIPEWLFKFTPHAIILGLNCCSNLSISFHYVDPTHQYVFEFLIYHLQVFGMSRPLQRFPSKRSMEEIEELFSFDHRDTIANVTSTMTSV